MLNSQVLSKTSLSLLVLALWFSPNEKAFSQEVSQVKGTKALINLGGTPASPGDEIYTLDSDGKRRGLVQIKQVKGDKAIGEIIKGRVEPGMSLKPKSEVSSAKESRGGSKKSRVQDVSSDETGGTESEEKSSRPKGFLGSFLKRGTALGFMGGFASNSMALTAKKGSTSEDLALASTSFNIVGIYDYDFSPMFTTRLKAGIENFDVKGSAKNASVCSDSSSCEVGFTYLSGAASGHFNFMRGSTRAYASVGGAFLIAMTKKSNISNLDTSSSTNQVIYLGGGADIGMGKGAFIPLSFEYGIYPGSTVKATSMTLRAGYAWRY